MRRASPIDRFESDPRSDSTAAQTPLCTCELPNLPSPDEADTVLAAKLYDSGHAFYTPSSMVVARGRAAGSGTRSDSVQGSGWTSPHGLLGDAARAFRKHIDLDERGVFGARGRLGIVDARDERECVAKYGSVESVRSVLTECFAWPAVAHVV